MDLLQLDSWHTLTRAIPLCMLLLIGARWLGHRLCPASYAIEVIVGFNLLGLVALLLCYMPPEIRSPVWLTLCIGCVIGSGLEYRSWRTAHPHTNLWPGWTWHRMSVTGAMLFSLGPALSYPAGWDELTYHMELPQRWAQADRPGVQWDLPYSGLPSLCELLFTLSFPWEPLVTPRLLNWVVWAHGLLALYQSAASILPVTIARAVAWSIGLSPVVLMVSANCYVEAFLLANVAALLLIFVQQLTSRLQLGQWLIVGCLMGGAIAIKVTSVGLLVVPALIWFMQSTTNRAPLKSLIMGWAMAGCMAVPFYIRPWWETGDPLWPYFAQWFISDPALLECSRYHHTLAQSNFGLPGVIGLVSGPIAIGFANELYDGYFGWQWWLVLAAAAAMLKPLKGIKPVERLAQAMLIAALGLYVLWFFSAQQARFAMPVLLLTTMVAGISLARFNKRVQPALAGAIIVLSIISVPWTNFGYYLDSWLCVLKIRTPVEYLQDGVGDSYLELVAWLGEHVDESDRVLTLFEHRLKYLPAGTEIATPYFQTKYFGLPDGQTPESVADEIRRQKIDYLILTTQPMGPDISPEHIADQQIWFGNIDQCIARGVLKVVWKSETHAVVEVAD